MGSPDAIVIGSGMGGLSCAAALARTGHRVLVLEQHDRAGGLMQGFSRQGFNFDVGMHYLGETGPKGSARRVLEWLCDGGVEMSSSGAVYDTVHFPGDFSMQFSRPEAALKRDLAEKFPGSDFEIDRYFNAVGEAVRAGRTVFTQRAMPPLLTRLSGWWHQPQIEGWWGSTTAEVLKDLISDPRLRAVLSAQRGDYGDAPAISSFGMQATVTHHYSDGAYYPVGGSKALVQALVAAIVRDGGALRLNARVERVLVEHGAVAGVLLADGSEVRATQVFSDVGALNTVGQLLDADICSEWGKEIQSFKPSACHVGLYLGLEGDVAASGGTVSNQWFYDSWDLDAGLWLDPFGSELPPAMFVSFPTLKDHRHDPGERQRHTAEIVVKTGWDAFRPWAGSRHGQRPQEYEQAKEVIEQRLLEGFARRFPALAPMVVCHELSTPLTTAAFTGAMHGASYGIETSPRRFLSDSLRVRTPVTGLFLTGQDVVTPGVIGAMMGGVLAAAAVEPRALAHLS